MVFRGKDTGLDMESLAEIILGDRQVKSSQATFIYIARLKDEKCLPKYCTINPRKCHVILITLLAPGIGCLMRCVHNYLDNAFLDKSL